MVKFDSDLNCLGAKYWGYSGSDYAMAGCAVDSNDNVYISGYCYQPPDRFPGSYNYYDAGIAKFDNNLNFVDDRLCGGDYYDYMYNLMVDDADEVYLSGYGYPYYGTSQYYDLEVVHLDEDLNKINTLTYGQTSRYDYYGNAVSDGSGNVFLMGRTDSNQFQSGQSYDAVVYKFDDDLDYQTGRWWGGTSYDYVYSYRCGDIAANGNVFMGGYTSSFGVTTYNFYVLEFDPSLNVVTQKLFDGGGSSYYCYGGEVACAGNTPILTGYRYQVDGTWSDITTANTGVPPELVSNFTALDVKSSSATTTAAPLTTSNYSVGDGVLDNGAGIYDFFVAKGYYVPTP